MRVTRQQEATIVATAQRRRRGERPRHELKLSFAELVLIYKSLQAVQTLGALALQDELLTDTMQLVDQALTEAFRQSA
jgi:hypothetical protein